MKIKQEKNQYLVLNMFKFRTSRVSYVDQNADGAINDNVISKQDTVTFSVSTGGIWQIALPVVLMPVGTVTIYGLNSLDHLILVTVSRYRSVHLNLAPFMATYFLIG